MRATLVRHLAPLVEPGVCYGRLDVPLHPAAVEDLPAFASRAEFRGAARVWSSPAQRCRLVAEAIGRALDAPLILDPRLRELDFGEWEGARWSSLDRDAFDRWAAAPELFAPPGGEQGAALIARVREAHCALLRDDENCVVVSHAGPLKVLAALFRQEPINLFNRSPAFGEIVAIDCASVSQPRRDHRR
jgi:alpha-ribazole phosphatase